MAFAVRLLTLLLLSIIALAACGSKDPPQPVPSAEIHSQQAPQPSAETPPPSPPPAAAPDEGSARDDAATTSQDAAGAGDVLAAIKELSDLGPNATQEQRDAALRKMMETASRAGRAGRNVKQPDLDLPPDWAKTNRIDNSGREAELLIQIGDIDNLGFGWPEDFDPFSGKSTPIHRFPWAPEADDPPGTDRIMVNTGFKKKLTGNKDGYTRDTDRPDNIPQAISISFDPKAVTIKSAVLQLFVDDFQSPVMKSQFVVTLDDRPAPDIEKTINKLNQTGPIGKLVTIRLLPEYLDLLADGKLDIFVDDPRSNVGDGFAFDFARLLLNPKGFIYAGTIRGIVVDKATDKPIDGALVSAANVTEATTKADGKFELRGVPAGLVITSGSHPDYVSESDQSDLLADEVIEIRLALERSKNEDLGERLASDGKVDLYGIYFDIDKAVLKPESEATLQQILSVLKSKPTLRLAVAGHTDAQASDAYNLDLSKRRAQAVVAWLMSNGIGAARLRAEGLGETQPVADNSSPAGRALNRRVEVRDISQGEQSR